MTFSSRLFAGAIIALAVPIAARAQTTVTLLDYRAVVPADWVSVPPTSSMRLAQFTIPARDVPVAAEVVVYFFGKGQGGTVEDNLARWKAQFSTPDGSPIHENVAHFTGTFPITVAEYRGTYARGVGAGDAENAKPKQTLIAVIAETPRGTLFFQLFGGNDYAIRQRGALIDFVRSMK